MVKRNIKKVRKMSTKTRKVEVTNPQKEVIKEVEVPIKNAEVKDGVFPSHLGTSKSVINGYATVGLSNGVTLNVGNYESARIDCFIQRTVEDTPENIKDTFGEMHKLIQEEIEHQASYLIED